jgi:hypothetical protein
MKAHETTPKQYLTILLPLVMLMQTTHSPNQDFLTPSKLIVVITTAVLVTS